MNSSTVLEKPKVIIGLGNPEQRFKFTRHNSGFEIVDALAAVHGGQWRSKNSCEIASIEIDGHEILLIKPQTYMNNSGDAVPLVKNREPHEVLVVHDELELPFGKMVVKVGGSARGHNGLRSIIDRWGTNTFARLRFGIGRPADKSFVGQYVLQKFDDRLAAERSIAEAVSLLEQLYRS